MDERQLKELQRLHEQDRQRAEREVARQMRTLRILGGFIEFFTALTGGLGVFHIVKGATISDVMQVILGLGLIVVALSLSRRG